MGRDVIKQKYIQCHIYGKGVYFELHKTVCGRTGNSLGSGIFISSDGIINKNVCICNKCLSMYGWENNIEKKRQEIMNSLSLLV